MLVQAPPFAEVLEQWSSPDWTPEVAWASVARSLAGEPDPWGLLGYLARLGQPVVSLRDLPAAIAAVDDEELSAHPCAEGVAVNQASDGRWLLFTP